MNAQRPLCALLAALGGQGGGVLGDWLVEAARGAGFTAQATSTPGVAQRTGATTYYFELFPDKAPPAKPIFSLFPSSDDVDLLAALEPTEAGRALERGQVTGRTTVITASARIYSTAEKSPAGDGTVATGPILDALEKAAGKLIVLDMKALAGASAAQANAIVLGAIAGSAILPLEEDAYRDAITTKGIAVAPNLAGFDAGIAAARAGVARPAAEAEPGFNPPPPQCAPAVERFPETLRPLIGHGIHRLIDYQGVAYADFYLDRLGRVLAVDTDPDYRLTRDVAGRLAAWMSYEDVIRVAQLKTRKGRLRRIREELNLPAGAPLAVSDYFKPGGAEIAAILPPVLARLVPARGRFAAGKGIAVHMPTGTAPGFALLKLVSGLAWLRPRSSQFAEEQNAIDKWLSALIKAAPDHYALALQTARLAIWARGYGRVRADGLERLAGVFTDWESRLAGDAGGVSVQIDQLLLLAHANPETTH